MSKDKYKAPQGSDSEFVDEILEEARKMRGVAKEELHDQDIPLAQARPVGNMYPSSKKPSEPVPQKPMVNPPTPEIAPPPISPEMPQQPTPQPGSNVVGNLDEDIGNKNKKKRLGKKHREEITAGEEDIYYGLKLKTVQEVKAQRREELKAGYTGGELKVSSPTSTFAHLFKDTEPVTSPEFQEKFKQLHIERQQRVKQAVKEAGAEVEDVFSLYEEPSEMGQTFTGLEIPKSEPPEKIVEKMVSEEFCQTHAKKDYHKISLEELYEEDLQAEKQSAELRQLIDDVLAKETVVEVDPPLHTESIFGLVAKERAQDTVEAEIAQEAAKLEAEQAEKQKKLPVQERADEITVPCNKVEEESAQTPAAVVTEDESSIKNEPVDVSAAENVEAAPQEQAEQVEFAGEQDAFEDPDNEMVLVFDEPETSQDTADVELQQTEASEQKEQMETQPEAVQEEQPASEKEEQAVAAEIVEEQDIDPVVKPMEYMFHTRPVRTFAIAGIGDVLAQEAKQFINMLSMPSAQTQVKKSNVQVQQEKQPQPKDKQQAPSVIEKQTDQFALKAAPPIKPPIKNVLGTGPRIINTSHFQIIDKTHLQNPTEESSVEHMDSKQSQQESVPNTEQAREPFIEQSSNHTAKADQQPGSTAGKDSKIVNIKAMKEQQTKAMKEQQTKAMKLQDMEQVPEYLPKKKKSIFGRNKMRILSDMEDEEEDIPEETVEDQPELEDFSSKEDIRSITGELRKNIRTLFLRSTVTGICTGVLLILGFFAEYHFFGANVSTVAYAVTSLVFLAIAIGICVTTVCNGLKSLVKLRANADSGIAIATVIVAIQSIVLLFMQDALAAGNVHIYTSLITGGLLLNTLGKLSMVRRIKQNFSFVASNADKNTVELVENTEIAAQLAKDCVAGVPVVAYQKKSKFFGSFLKNSYAQDCSEQTSQVIAPLGFISSLVLFIVSLIISRDVGTGFTAFAASMCICVPMANMLCVHLPVSRLCKLARKNGGMLVGYEAAEKFADTNAVMIEADDLFPKDTVELKGIKTFGEQRIDKVLLDAAALLKQVGGPLSEVFLEVVKNHEEILPYVENVAYQDECGVIGWVSGRRILVGNRDLMNHYGINVPAVHIDKQQNQQLVYIAAGGEAVGAFILAYHVSNKKRQEMQRMARNGIGIIVKTTDPSVTSAFISDQFDIGIHAITVLSGPLVHTYEELTGKEEESSNAMFATKGKATCMMRVITACVRERSNISIVRLLQNISVALGFVLVAFLVCFSGLKQISTLAMVIYQVFWLVVLLVLPKIRRS